MADTLLTAATYNAWFASLNSIRTKHGASTFTNTIAAGTRATAALMTNVQNAINTTKGTDNHMTGASIDTTVPTIAAGNIIAIATKNKIDSIITSLNSVCHYDSVCSYSPCSDERRNDDPTNYKCYYGD